MKTPGETKRGLYSIDETLEILRVRTGIIHDRDKLYRSALAIIERLDKDCVEVEGFAKRLRDQIEQLEAERDFLVKYLTDSHWASCDICKHEIDGAGAMGCKRIREIKGPCFEWRGLPEQSKEE